MANKAFPKKVVKNMEKGKIQRRSCRVMKHFEPAVNLASCRANLHATIPPVNVESEDEPQTPLVPKRVHASLRRKVPMTNPPNVNSIPVADKQLRPLQIGLAKLHPQGFKSSSSSSLESKIEKFTNRSKTKPILRKSQQVPKAIKSAREKGSANSNSTSLKSVTDPALIQRELNLKSLKQEIIENRKFTNGQGQKPSVWDSTSPRLEGLKAEILRSKTDKLLHKKVLITELRSEIAQYKQFSKFQVYSNYEGNITERQRNSSNPSSKRVSLQEDQLGRGSVVPGGSDRQPSPTDKDPNIDSSEGSRCSDSTAESKSKRGSDAESIDDSIIQNKIKEANQLIDRVKKALGKIKSRKACEAPIDNNIEVKSSSTDIEETIRALKKETEQLITGDADDEPVGKAWKRPCNSCPAVKAQPQKSVFDRKTLNSNDFHETDKPRISLAKDPQPTSEGVNLVAPPLHNKCRIGIETIDFQRPKTRRNEADDDYSGPLRRDKFCTRPEMEHLQITSSFEELQERLETISETTESSYSTPRAKKALIRDQQHKSCSTEPLCAESKEVQVMPETNTTGICCSCPSENKKVQTGCRFLMKDVAVETVPPTPKRLQMENLAAEDIPPSSRRCNNCQVEFLPVLEILPAPQKIVCDKCRMTLQEDNVPGVSLPSKLKKLQRLTIQVLPPIIIKQGLTLRQVLNLSIDPNGKCINQVQNTDNVAYIATTSNDHRVNWSSRKQEDMWFSNELQKPLNEQDDVNLGAYDEESVALDQSESCIAAEEREVFDERDPEELEDAVEDYLEPDVKTFNQIVKSNLDKTENAELTNQSSLQSTLSHDEALVEEIDNDDQFVSKSQLRPSGDIDDLIAELVKSEKLNPELEEQLRNRILWYKSYHIYDNPNKHDPGPLDQKSMEKISQMDLKFYKTFINPNPTLSQELFTPRESKNQLMGFESKMVQCNESMLLEGQKPFMPSRFCSDDDKASFLVNREKELDSTVTVLRMKDADLEDDKKVSKPMQSNYVMRGSYLESDSSPSEITVTISYTVSSDDKAQNSQDTEKSISELHETEVKTVDLEDYQELRTDQSLTNPETQDKMISLKDKEVISKLRDKLKCVDTTSSQPTFTLKKQSADVATVDQFLKGLTTFNELEKSSNKHSIDSNSPNSKDPQAPHTVNYLLSQDVAAGNGHVKHLELGANGRYRDEEDLFAQVPYPQMSKSYKSRTGAKPSLFDHRDKEVARDRFEIVPRQRLRRYSPDTSNSDTVTTNSVSEGEILCKHSVSNGEIHACRHRPPCPRLQRTILTKRNFWIPPTHCTPYNLPTGVPRKFDLDDPKVTIEQRRNYFNNWVTYYVKPQDVHESTTSSCSNNK